MAVVEALDAVPGDRRRPRLRSPAIPGPLDALEAPTVGRPRSALERRFTLWPARSARAGGRGHPDRPHRRYDPISWADSIPERTLLREEDALRQANQPPYRLGGRIRLGDPRESARSAWTGSLGRWPS